jgi:hypothetical protein
MKGWTLADLYSLTRTQYEALCELFEEYLKALNKD